MKKLILPVLGGLVLLTSVHAAEPAGKFDESALKHGRKSAQFCRHCHGVGGSSVRPDTPNLAGQNEVYLLEQMNKYVTGQRKDEFMEGLIKALTPEERKHIALYYSQEKVVTRPITNPARVQAGKKLYERLCISCHGASGYGTEKIPRLAGQQQEYVQASLKRYRNGTGERIDPQMAAYTRNLKDSDIQNLADYLASMQ